MYNFCTSECHSIFQTISSISEENFPASLVYMSYFCLLINRCEYLLSYQVIKVPANYFLRRDSIENILNNYGLPTNLKNRILVIKETNDTVQELFSNPKRKEIN